MYKYFKILTEDDCLAFIVDEIFGKCRGYPVGKWSKVIHLLQQKFETIIGIIDNDNYQEMYLIRNNWKLEKNLSNVEANSEIKVYSKLIKKEKDNAIKKYIIVIDPDCEKFLKCKDKIREKNEKRTDTDKKKLDKIREVINKIINSQ